MNWGIEGEANLDSLGGNTPREPENVEYEFLFSSRSNLRQSFLQNPSRSPSVSKCSTCRVDLTSATSSSTGFKTPFSRSKDHFVEYIVAVGTV